MDARYQIYCVELDTVLASSNGTELAKENLTNFFLRGYGPYLLTIFDSITGDTLDYKSANPKYAGRMPDYIRKLGSKYVGTIYYTYEEMDELLEKNIPLKDHKTYIEKRRKRLANQY